MEKNRTTIILRDLPKVSLNKFYSGMHWAERKQLKDTYALLVRSKSKKTFTEPCTVAYTFVFKSKPLDCSNCVGMIKLIEDVLFPDDSPNIIKSLNIRSMKGANDYVLIDIYV